jgi:Putative prokaryotic signal transducing protein
MFCPQCKAEYRVGFVRCTDCDVELVDHLPVHESSPVAEFPRGRFEAEPKLVVIRTFQRGLDADLAKSVLEAAGIASMIRGDAGRRYYYSYGLALGTGIELLVRVEDAEDADKILDMDVTDGNDSTEPKSS